MKKLLFGPSKEYRLGPVLLILDTHAYFYFRIGHFQITLKNTRKHYLLFSERNGHYTGFRIGRYLFKFMHFPYPK